MEFDFEKYQDLVSATSQMAMLLRLYYDALIREGFTEMQAMYLVAEYQKILHMGGARVQSNDQ